MNNLGEVTGILESTPPDKFIYEVVRPETDPSHIGARIRKAGDLKAIIQECLDLWNSQNNADNQRTSLEYCYVFVVLGKSRVAISGADVRALTGIKTQDYMRKEEIHFNLGPEKSGSWI